jgi:hypothetical protein
MLQLKELQMEQVRVLSATMVEPEVQRAPVAESTEGELGEREGSTGREGAQECEIDASDTSTVVGGEGRDSAEAARDAERQGSAPRAAIEDDEMLSLD